ncbi:MAG TPA: hypothetical protein VNS09_02335 [Solirubrobacter sp.]|nr:hypothetical protein [Solirubrobacter sp.]
MSAAYRTCAVCAIRCFPEDDFHPLPAGGGYCDRCAAVGGFDWLAKFLGVDREGFALCPGHGDKGRPNLHVSRSERDPRDAVVFCHAGCGSDVDLILGALGLSRWHLYHPANHLGFGENIRQGSRVKGQGQRQDVSVGVSGSSTGTSRGEKVEAGDALDERLERWRAGLLEPEPVELPVDLLPRQAKALRALVAQIELWMGLRLADFEYRPMPLSTRFVARRMGWLKASGEPDDSRGWNALRKLVAVGVLAPGEPLDGRGDWPGTRTFLPPEPLATALGFALAGGDAVEGESGGVELAVPEPHAELADQAGVDGTQTAAGQDHGMVAVGLDAAGRHGVEATAVIGGSRLAIYDDD